MNYIQAIGSFQTNIETRCILNNSFTYLRIAEARPLTANTFLKQCAHKREYTSVIRKCGNASHTSSRENRKTEVR